MPLLLEEALVLAHHHLGFQSADSFEGNTDNNDDRSAADGKIGVAQNLTDDQRADCHDAEIDRAEQRNLVEDLGNKVRRRPPLRLRLLEISMGLN